MAKIEPINLLAEITRKDNSSVQRITAGKMSIERKKGQTTEYLLSELMAEELALEAWAYKEYWEASSLLASLMDQKHAGQYVADHTMQFAQDSFIQARDHCRALQKNKPNTQDTKVRRE